MNNLIKSENSNLILHNNQFWFTGGARGTITSKGKKKHRKGCKREGKREKKRRKMGANKQ